MSGMTYRWSVRVRAGERVAPAGEDATARAGRVGHPARVSLVHVRQHRFEVGEPVQFDEDYPGITALEYLLGALGADIVGVMRRLAKKNRWVFDPVEAVVRGELDNALTFLEVVGEKGQPALSRIEVRVYVGGGEPEERVRQVWEEMLTRSPLVLTLRRSVRLELSLRVESD